MRSRSRRTWAGPGRHRGREGQRGSSLVEMAIMAPILTALVLWLVYFWEMHSARIRAAEAARYIAWQRTALPSTAGIGAEARTRFADLDGSTPTGVQGSSFWNRLTIEQSDAADAAASSGSGGVGGVLQMLGFDTSAGAVQSTVRFRMENRVMPRRIGEYLAQVDSGRAWTLDRVFTDSYFTDFETWRAWRWGDNLASADSTVQSHVRRRMDDLVYAGIMGSPAGTALSSLGYVVGFFGLDVPLSRSYVTRVTRILHPLADGTPVPEGPTRTSLGDKYYAAYWYADRAACRYNQWCQPSAIRNLRDRNNGDYRAFHCRGNFYLGTTRSGYSEYTYAYERPSLERSVFRFHGSDGCE